MAIPENKNMNCPNVSMAAPFYPPIFSSMWWEKTKKILFENYIESTQKTQQKRS